jgi:hypothetical protein
MTAIGKTQCTLVWESEGKGLRSFNFCEFCTTFNYVTVCGYERFQNYLIGEVILARTLEAKRLKADMKNVMNNKKALKREKQMVTFYFTMQTQIGQRPKYS